MVENATWSDGRMRGKHALLFNGPADYVRINLPQKVDDLTLAAWVCVEWLHDSLSSLLVSEKWGRKGQLAWQLWPDGHVRIQRQRLARAVFPLQAGIRPYEVQSVDSSRTGIRPPRRPCGDVRRRSIAGRGTRAPTRSDLCRFGVDRSMEPPRLPARRGPQFARSHRRTGDLRPGIEVGRSTTPIRCGKTSRRIPIVDRARTTTTTDN